ncbi:MAG: bifunctional diaminohydroxyphosphoribosylaminopyrimidine deaminase/5-amino-6-(5-phosphoribosylamino)uracil reductase RibD [Candidatus Omnitrophica bacterium]|nr:bifunctional diaminohydroxyphosphoribosylaminopyrimidine deaminase/5-amino-6-(5-phosphoribosylamino)uracil reductase RibD [Candidatus Omnitrophota bacterium]
MPAARTVVSEERALLQQALRLARRGDGAVSPNPLVGALVVKGGKIIGRGYHRRCGGPHAEVYALRQAGTAARGATLIVTLEPCNHYGRTPPCTEAILQAGIARVVVGMRDPHPLMNGKSLQRLAAAGIEVAVAVDPRPFQELNRIFIKYVTQRTAYCIVKVGQSLDGKIATAGGDSQWITGDRSRAYVQQLRRRVDAVMVGINTVLADNPRLSCRLRPRRAAHKPVKIIIDPRLRTPVAAGIFSAESPAPVLVVTRPDYSRKKAAILAARGAKVIACPLLPDRRSLNLQVLARELAAREISSVLVEGGGGLIGSCFDQQIVDEVYFFIAPMIIGGRQAVSAVAGRGSEQLNGAIRLSDIRFRRVGEDFLMRAMVQYPPERHAINPPVRTRRAAAGPRIGGGR